MSDFEPKDRSLLSARELVLHHGWNANVYQILNPKILHWHASDGDAIVGYVRRHRTIVVAGTPVCTEGRLTEVAREFEAWAGKNGDSVCYFGVEERFRTAMESSSRRTTIAIGAQPVWDPKRWAEIVQDRKSLRAQLNRARNKGVVVSILHPPEMARQDRGLRLCLNDWLASRPLPPMRFLADPDTIDGALTDRIIFVARRQSAGEADAPVGFLIASPAPLRNGYQIEQIARRRDAPNGAAELLIDAAMRELAARGNEYVTLGLVALAEQARASIARNPFWLRAMMTWARAHGNRFYNFSGLEAFRAKMAPDRWDTVYAIADGPRFSPMMLHAIAAAFCEGSPALALVKALGKALRSELQWASGRVHRRPRIRVA